MFPMSLHSFTAGLLLCFLVLTVPASASPPAPTGEVRPDTLASVQELQPIEVVSLESLLGREIRGGEMGSYGLRMSEFQITPELHGYVSAEMKGSTRGHVSTYDLHHTVLVARAELLGKMVPEVAVEYEHAGTEFYMSYAQVDLEASPELIFRVGYFVAPVGAFNEYQYADFLRKTVIAPIAMAEIIPALWSEVGLQVRGKVVDAAGRGVNYAIFSSNGLEQFDADPNDDVVPEGGRIRDMRSHAEDGNNADKAFGGRLGGSLGQRFNMGVSGYRGAYTSDGRRDLTLMDSDLTFHSRNWLLRCEVASARQEILGGALNKRGGFILLANHVTASLEPYIQGESADLGGMPDPVRRRIVAGTVYYPFPDKAQSIMVKFEGAVTRLSNNDAFGQFLTQLTIAF